VAAGFQCRRRPPPRRGTNYGAVHEQEPHGFMMPIAWSTGRRSGVTGMSRGRGGVDHGVLPYARSCGVSRTGTSGPTVNARLARSSREVGRSVEARWRSTSKHVRRERRR
jgi:hypothetical protein